MAYIYDEPSRTFAEFLLLPNLTEKHHVPDNVDLKTPLVKFRQDEQPAITLNLPICSAIMQSVSDDGLAIALARAGGISFIYVSQSIQSQAEMVRRVKRFKAGFVISDSNLRPDSTVQEMLELVSKSGHSTMPVTDD